MELKPGDRLNVSATYDTTKASWYESMGIMVVVLRRRQGHGAKDPFKPRRSTGRGSLPTATWPRTMTMAGARPSLPDARKLPGGAFSSDLKIGGYIYGLGDSMRPGERGRPPRVRAGDSRSRSRTTTPCRRCRRRHPHTTRSPRARRPATAPRASPTRSPTARRSSTPASSATARAGFTPAANRNTWQTPKSLKRRHLHLLLPHPPVHARRLPGREGQGLARTANSHRRPDLDRRARQSYDGRDEQHTLPGSIGVGHNLRPGATGVPPRYLRLQRDGAPHERNLQYCRPLLDAPERIRTSDLRFRRPTLYPAELRAQAGLA